MTLADLIRQYLEDRRKQHTRKKIRPLEENGCNLAIRENDDSGLVTVDNKQYFSNNIDPKNERFGASPHASITRQLGVSKSKRVVNLPDGSIQIETIIRDSNGNEEKHITTQKGDVRRTVIIRKDASGAERTEERVTDTNDYESLASPFRSDTQSDASNEYDFWFRKFFKPGNLPSTEDAFKRENSPFDFNANADEQIEQLFKLWTRSENFFDPFSRVLKREVSSKDKDDTGEIPYFDDIPKLDGSLLNEETRRLIENFEKSTSSSAKTFSKKNHVSPKQMERLLKNIAPPASPSLFEQFADNAMVEIPDEKTPLDRFISLDEDHLNSVRKIQRERDEAIKKLDKYLSSTVGARSGDIYSDIGDEKDVECSLILPRTESGAIHRDFGQLFRKAFDATNSFDRGFHTRMFVENGKKRVESVGKNEQGLTQKTILYEIGDSRYNVIIVTDKSGQVMKREKHFNFPEEELPNFRKQWSKNFQTDFED